ncbi:MAG: AMP-binding protein, partial [Planctomycetota bacterium]
MTFQARTLIDILRGQRDQSPDHAACHVRNESNRWIPVSRAEILDRMEHAAAALRRLGLVAGDRLAIQGRTNDHWLVFELAALRLGAVVVGIDPRAPAGEIREILADSGARGLLVENPAMLAACPAEDIGFRMTFSGMAALSREASPLSPEIPAPGGNDPAALIYTSGTTGKAKGIIYTHAQIMAAHRAILAALPILSGNDRTIAWLPMSNLLQRMINGVALTAGVGLYFVEDPREIARCFQEVRPTVFVGVPRFYQKVRDGVLERLGRAKGLRRRLAQAALVSGKEAFRARTAGQPLSLAARLRHAALDALVLRKIRKALGGKIRILMTGSAATPRDVLEFFHAAGLPLLESYGVSENTIPVTLSRLDAFRVGSVGRPLPENEVVLAADGEVLVRGPGLFRGYTNGTAPDAFTADGFYRTGDLG